jgi:hypothetical protein
MIERSTALEIAARDTPKGIVIDEQAIRELPSGWFFPYRSEERLFGGSQGVIVNKKTGNLFRLGSAFPVERDLELYERGYQFAAYDLVVTEIADLDVTIKTLEELDVSVVEPAYDHGTVWRIPRRLSAGELRRRLDRLPAVFGELRLYARAEALEGARVSGAFRFELLECKA